MLWGKVRIPPEKMKLFQIDHIFKYKKVNHTKKKQQRRKFLSSLVMERTFLSVTQNLEVIEERTDIKKTK